MQERKAEMSSFHLLGLLPSSSHTGLQLSSSSDFIIIICLTHTIWSRYGYALAAKFLIREYAKLKPAKLEDQGHSGVLANWFI
ncbi:hypothetical protein SLE2022_143320 [Rubroshorea leprosula]